MPKLSIDYLIGSDLLQACKQGLESVSDGAHNGCMTSPAPEKAPVMLPFPDKEGGGWHVIIRYHHGHERRIDGFATEKEALDWIIANSGEVDDSPP
jgi:hypothetical protein